MTFELKHFIKCLFKITRENFHMHISIQNGGFRFAFLLLHVALPL